MCKIFVWTPESDYDAQTVIGFANKIINFRAISNLKLQKGTKQAYNNAAKKENGLETAVNIYLKDYDYLLFLIDADGVQSQAQRSKETNSLFNRINRVVMNQKFSGRVKLILFRQELEGWLLVDCLGICCYYTKNNKTRSDTEWQNFAKKYQRGRTEDIIEAESGGKGAKEYLEDFSKEIAKRRNPQLQDKDLKKHKYTENQSPEITQYIEINQTTIKRNQSLEEFDQYLCDYSNLKP